METLAGEADKGLVTKRVAESLSWVLEAVFREADQEPAESGVAEF